VSETPFRSTKSYPRSLPSAGSRHQGIGEAPALLPAPSLRITGRPNPPDRTVRDAAPESTEFQPAMAQNNLVTPGGAREIGECRLPRPCRSDCLRGGTFIAAAEAISDLSLFGPQSGQNSYSERSARISLQGSKPIAAATSISSRISSRRSPPSYFATYEGGFPSRSATIVWVRPAALRCFLSSSHSFL